MENLTKCSLSSFFQSHRCATNFLCAIGLYYASKMTLKSLLWIKKFFFSSVGDLKAKYGDGWVVITGGSEGIGYAFAERFLELKFKVCIISRNEEKLKNASSALISKYPEGQVKYLVYDFDNSYTEKDIKILEEKILSVCDDISILFNNVGVIHRAILTEMPNEKINSMVNVNVYGLVYTTKVVLGIMQKQSHRSLMIGSGSVSGLYNLPTRCIYGATKKFMESFFDCIGREYSNVDCTNLIIGAVETALNKLKMPMNITNMKF